MSHTVDRSDLAIQIERTKLETKVMSTSATESTATVHSAATGVAHEISVKTQSNDEEQPRKVPYKTIKEFRGLTARERKSWSRD